MKCIGTLAGMKLNVIPCGTLKVNARKMHNHLPESRIRSRYRVDPDGTMRIAMNALLVDDGERLVIFDPGCADFLPSRFIASYGLEISEPMETILERSGYRAEQVTDVVFTHLHFDHGTGAFAREPGRICKRFPNADYRVLKEHFDYAQKPHESESNSFALFFFRYLDRVHWLEEWKVDWLELKVCHGHTKFMAVPGIRTGTGLTWFLSDLVPMESFLEPDVCSEYDLDPGLALGEKNQFLAGIAAGSELIFFHDPLTDRKIYS
jgi:glyoxylase-like metal-dependent hydrolase (beta-lactamase superfamily II)